MANWTSREIPRQQGKLAVITGANSGIGWYTALELARAGAEVILASRSAVKGDESVARIQSQIPRALVRTEVLDLASLASVHAFAEKINREPKVDLLVNNAGVMAVPNRRTTQDGFELQVGTNYLGPFALTLLLMPALRRAPSPRVTTVSSSAANMGLRRINFEDMQWEKSYGPWKAYCQSKLADLMFMLELGRRSKASGFSLLSNGAHPGFARTNLQTSGPGRRLRWYEKAVQAVMSQDAAQGALPTLRAATQPDAAMASYFGPSFVQLKGAPVPISIPKPALDEAASQKLWEVSEELTQVRWQV